MSLKRNIWLAVGLSLPLAIIGCMKTNQDATNINSPGDIIKAGTDLDALHGGARVVLPEIDPATLNKQTANGIPNDTLPAAWFELTVSGTNMSDMFFKYPLGTKGGYSFEIKGIPSGKSRSFNGRLLNRSRQLTHEGTTVTDIRAGELADLHLYLAKASGSANVCVVIEGQKPPACALDSFPPLPDTQMVSHCWYVGSDSLNGRLSLYDQPIGMYSGVLITNNGIRLPVTTWGKVGDTLSAVVIRPSMDKKWRLSGVIQTPYLWMGSVMGLPMETPFSFYGKPISCTDTLIVPPIDTVQPPKDTTKATSIPRASEAGELTRCMEMRIDYGNACELYAFAKMSFVSGQIAKGYITVADRPSRQYAQIQGRYDQSSIHIESVLPSSGTSKADSMMFDGAISSDRTMAKGSYVRLPAGKKGIWTLNTVVCGNLTPRYPDSSCFVPVKIPK